MDNMGFGYEAEGTQVTQADPCQYDVAQLPTGRFHYWGVPEPEHRNIHTSNYSTYSTCRNTNIQIRTYANAKTNTHSRK